MNKRIGVVTLMAATGLLLSACAWTPHEIALQPQVSTPSSTVGQGTRVAFHITDERDETTVGNRGVGAIGAHIDVKDLPATLATQLKDSLTRKGYSVFDTESGTDAILTYRLRAFKFHIEEGFWTGGEESSVVLAVDATRNGKTYSNVYRYNADNRSVVIPTGGQIDSQMNTALNQVLQQAVSDVNLDSFLTGKTSGRPVASN